MDSDFNVGRRLPKLAAVTVTADPNEDAQVSNAVLDNFDSLPDKPSSDKEFLAKLDAEPPKTGKTGSSGDSNNPKVPWYKRILAWIKHNQRLAIIIASVVILAIAGGVSYALTRPDKPESQTTSKRKPKPKPVVITSPLTGAVVSEEDSKRPVIGVMIENSTLARPQSGLDQAGVVFEAIAEYGITRFLALYQEANPGNLGPVRSARPYYVDWARSFDAAYAHVGGSPDALAKIKADGARDLDQFANSGSYRRIGNREAPHNVYTTMEQLRQLTASKGWAGSTFDSLLRKKEAPVKPEKTNAKVINIGISGPTYDVHYDYDPANNTYLRTMGGAPHTDADSGARIAPKVVIGLATAYGLMPDGYHSNYTIAGGGAVKIFQDGVVIEGTWKRDAPNSQYKFFDAQNNPLALNPGQTWITVVGDPATITYAP